MENNNKNLYVCEEEREIDLIELFLYVCRKWRVLLALGLIGVLIGCGIGFVKNAKKKEISSITNKQPELKKEVQLEQIEAYAKMFDVVKAAKEEALKSVYLNLDSQNTYVASIEYLLQVKHKNTPVISKIYAKILNNEKNMTQLITASGINECTPQDMRKMVEMYVDVPIITASGINECTPQDMRKMVEMYVDVPNVENLTELKYEPDRIVTIGVVASILMPNKESCARVLEALNGQIQKMNIYVESTYKASLMEKIVKAPEKEVNNQGLLKYKKNFSENLRRNSETLEAMKKKLTKDDMAYYEAFYGDDEQKAKNSLKTVLKWAILLCIAFGAMGAMGFAVAFVIDGHIKNVDELLAYGLYPVAVLEENKNINLNAIDKLFVAKRHYQTDEYLASSLDNLGVEKLILCGDLEDNDIREHIEKAVKICGKFSLGDQMIQNADVQQMVKQAEGMVLFVHLWKTKRIDLEQELRICQKIGAKLLGVAVIG